MTFEEVLDQAIAMIQRRGRVTYRTLQRQFQLDDTALDDLKGSMELLADRDPEEARQLLDPVLERMMAAVHRYEGTVNLVMGDGIMALFGAPLAHEDHAVRACYAALAMQAAVKQYASEVQRTYGVPLQIRVGLNAGEVVVRAIGNDLHMDYSAIGQTTHVAARMEQMAMAGSILMTQALVSLAEGALALARAHQERGNQAYALRLLGDIAARRDPPQGESAVAHYQQALALAGELGMRPLQAHCHLGLGTLYATTGQQEQARAELSAAIELYRGMAMTFWLPQAESALAQVE